VKDDLNHTQSVLYIFGCCCIRPVNRNRIQMETERKVTHNVMLRVVSYSCRAACVVLILNADYSIWSLFYCLLHLLDRLLVI